MSNTCTIKFDFDHSRLTISAFNPQTGNAENITRGDNSVERINDICETYRMLVARRSFAEETDRGVVSSTEQLGQQLYELFFSGLEGILDSCSNIVLYHSKYLLPLELAFDGKEFIGLKYSVGNWLKEFGPSKIQAPTFFYPMRSHPINVLFLGEESESVFNLFDKYPSCTKMKNTKADKFLMQLHSQHYDVLHVACHGQFDGIHPERSFLILDNKTAGKTESAVLRGYQLAQAPLYHSLVVLNACQSGRVDENYQGFVGFVDSFLRAGAANCITTLWSISDRSASRFVRDFYVNLLDGVPIGEALRTARVKCWNEDRDVLTSLAYILFGNPVQVIQTTTTEHEDTQSNQP